jgi:hypothetical protein
LFRPCCNKNRSIATIVYTFATITNAWLGLILHLCIVSF